MIYEASDVYWVSALSGAWSHAWDLLIDLPYMSFPRPVRLGRGVVSELKTMNLINGYTILEIGMYMQSRRTCFYALVTQC